MSEHPGLEFAPQTTRSPILPSMPHSDYKRIEAASGDEPRNKLKKSNGGQI